MPQCGFSALAIFSSAWATADVTSIYKVDYPVAGLCGQESNVTKSDTNPHWLFPIHVGGFQEGQCSDIGYTRFNGTRVVEMHPVPWVHHNLTFELYQATQTHTITIELPDTARGKRIVKMKLCMPTGSGSWPLFIFGHGAGCDAEDYQYFCQVSATAMIYQDSPAGSIFPADFDTAGEASDAAFLAKELPRLSTKDPTSPLYGKLDGTVIIGGHSMGGGIAVLSVGKHEAPVNGLVLFAPGLYTKPDATPFLANITAPALIISGSMDCGQNALDKQAYPVFKGLASKSKVLLVLKGANHCQWIQPFEKGLGVCSSFEANECHGISRRTQHNIGNRLVSAFAMGLASSNDWESFEKILSSGEADGIWSYFSSRTSDSRKRLHNDCPCNGVTPTGIVI